MLNLKLALRLNAASCILFAALLVTIPAAVAQFLASDQAPTWLLSLLGWLLLANGALLISASMLATVPKALVVFFSLGDLAWVLMTLALIITGVWISTAAGISVSLLIAVWVAWLGWQQWKNNSQSAN